MTRTRTTARSTRALLLLLSTFALAATGCGSDKKPDARPPAAYVPPQPTAQMQPAPLPPPSSPTASAITIDDAILKACGIASPKAHFAFDSANVQNQDTSTLEQVARCFVSGPLKGRTLKLIGHADPRGETEYNFVLGNSRADAVGGFLRSKGMDNAKIATSSRGELDAVGNDEPGWARDRRVDMLLGN
jgi:peptidoglycan-associated lipoprotein